MMTKRIHQYLIYITLFNLFFGVSQTVFAQQSLVEKSYLGQANAFNSLNINTIWSYCPNKDTAGYQWQSIHVATLSDKKGKRINWKGHGWFKTSFNIPDSLKNKPIYLKMAHLGASKVFVDGVKVAGFGAPSSNANLEKPFVPHEPVIIQVLAQTHHQLVVEYSNHRTLLPGGVIQNVV